MVKKHNRTDDFNDFLNNENNQKPSEYISNEILMEIKNDLEPSLKLTFSKIFAVQLIIGIITTLICPQFQLSFVNNHHVFHYFHANFGELGCMSICGSIFVGSGAVLSNFFLSTSELNLIHKKSIIFYLVFNLLFLSLFKILGAEIEPKLALFWTIGAMFSGIILFELSRTLKLYIYETSSL